MDKTIQQLKIIQMCLLLSIVLYAFLAARAPIKPLVPNPLLYNVFLLLSAIEIAAALFVRSKLLSASQELQADTAQVKAFQAKLMGAHILPWALCECVALYGFVLRYLGFPLARVSVFFFAGFLLILFVPPRQPVPSR